MPPVYFVDTWYLIARYDRFDGQHAAARSIERRISDSALVTHDAILTEFLAFFAERGAYHREEAVRFMRMLMRRATVLPADRQLFTVAVDFYDSRRDKQYSLVDCMSMLVMQAHGIHHVLTNDHHFAQERFTVVNA